MNERIRSLYESGPLVSADGRSVGSIGVVDLFGQTVREMIGREAGAFNAKPTRPTPYEITLAHHRRPGARTLGAWRNKVALPEVLLDVLVGSDPPETVLTPETIVACGLLAVRTLRGAVAS